MTKSNSDLESNVEYQEWACDAIGFPTVAYDEKYESDVIRQIPKCGVILRPWVFEKFKTAILMLDVSNIILDYALMLHLLFMAHYAYAGLVGVMTTVSTIVLIWMKWLMYRVRKDLELPPERILGILLVTELFIFFVQKVSTIITFVSVDADRNLIVGDYLQTLPGAFNVYTTILSGIFIIFLLILFIIMSIYEGEDGLFERLMTLCFTLPPICTILDISYMLYFAIDKVLLENYTDSKQLIDLRDGFVINIVVFPILLFCTNIAIKLAYASKGSKHDYDN
jgi:hypothetical protein